jgi:hypothetical protein
MVQHVIETQIITVKFERSPLVLYCSPFFLQDALDEEVHHANIFPGLGGHSSYF